MIPHSYGFNPNSNPAQWDADQCGRQEVTVDWYLDHMIDCPIFRWVDPDMSMSGDDPWRLYYDLPLDPEEIKKRGWRLFVQKRDMPKD